MDSEWSLEIIRGVERVVREAGMTLALTARGPRNAPGPDWVSGVRDTGEREASRLLGLSDRPTAIVAGNDLQALGVYDAAAALGLTMCIRSGVRTPAWSGFATRSAPVFRCEARTPHSAGARDDGDRVPVR
ncbi:hypothetical protein [Leifsonia poae]|uniref:hypothetical protein n=1 Tax=Leifsonia poae TaxID=110933 RepID=UPI001CC16D5A|nr:hypothetical protein [Leifsonia poae]